MIGRMFALLRMMTLDDPELDPQAPNIEGDHYLYFRGIPVSPDDYIDLLGASSNLARKSPLADACVHDLFVLEEGG